jgi:hypothetical protein
VLFWGGTMSQRTSRAPERAKTNAMMLAVCACQHNTRGFSNDVYFFFFLFPHKLLFCLLYFYYAMISFL